MGRNGYILFLKTSHHRPGYRVIPRLKATIGKEGLHRKNKKNRKKEDSQRLSLRGEGNPYIVDTKPDHSCG